MHAAIQYNLNLDDLLPRLTDFSLLYRLVDAFPAIKVTVFVPISSRDWGDGENDIMKHPAWCRKVAELPRENFELSCHGWCHHLEDKMPEFKHLSHADATALLIRCEWAFSQMELPYVRGFRPPCWEMSSDTVRALEDLRYLYVSDSPRFYEAHGSVRIPRIFANSDVGANEKYAEVKPFLNRGILPDPQQYCIQRGHLVSRLHNNLTLRNFQNVVRTVESLGDVEFKFLSEIAGEWQSNYI